MSSLIKAVILILSLNSQAKWEDWNTTDKRLFKAYIAATTLDYMQTKNALDNHYIEGNPFLGKYPSSDRILLQKTLSAGIIYWSSNKLNEKNRRRGLIIANGIQWGVVINNENIGATFKYNW
jgi:hypothetical protein